MFLLAFLPSVMAAQPADVTAFSSLTDTGALLSNWQTFVVANNTRQTRYQLISDNATMVVQALSDNSASGLYHDVDIDLSKSPLLQWRWKISDTIRGGDARRRQGDDYAARIYVEFEYDIARLDLLTRMQYEAYKLVHGKYPPLAVLNYIWANQLAVGDMLDNVYSSRVKMFAVESGRQYAGQWRNETRNLYADYLRAFGEAPGRVVGIAIMTDSDNTATLAEAYYGDIRFLPGPVNE